jgi:hypothetical protein
MKSDKVVKKFGGALKIITNKNYGFYLENYGTKTTVFTGKACYIPVITVTNSKL